MDKIRFASDFLRYAFRGGFQFYIWILFLSFFILLWLFGNFQQLSEGMIVTNLSDQVTWGIYVSNFIFLVGVAAAAVTVVFPSYVYDYKPLKDVVVLGEMLAITAVIVSLLFIFNHMGRLDRIWHMVPPLGIFNWPGSILVWDVIVLNGYLFLNIICGFYLLYRKYTSQPLDGTFYMPLVYISIVWALSIHTVTAFLLNTLPSRPMWFHSIVPIKFIATAFASGPSLIILAFFVIRRKTPLKISDKAINMLAEIVTYSLGVSLFLTLSEIVTEFYPGTGHSYSLKYLMFGSHGLKALVPWFWASLALNVTAFLLLLDRRTRKNHRVLPIVCLFITTGIWIEKGIGFILPGMIPSPLGEYSQYFPSLIEIINSLGNWAIGLLIFTILAKGSVGVLLGEVRKSTV